MQVKAGATIICFGEIMLRLSAALGTRIANAPSLSLNWAGAEANVGALLAQLGHEVIIVTVLPCSPLGDRCEAELRRTGLVTEWIIRGDGRLGLYFFEPGAGQGGRVVYDRKNSAFSQRVKEIDWSSIAKGAHWFHLSGINLAVSKEAAEASVVAVRAMRAAGATISFDVNHRASLWETTTSSDAVSVREVANSADVMFASPADLARMLGRNLPMATSPERREAAEAAFDAFPQLRLLASTQRWLEHGWQSLSARIDTPTEEFETNRASIRNYIDRIGSGDAFAGGVIDGILQGASIQSAARAGLAAAVMKHGISGDQWIGTREELNAFDPFRTGDIQR